MDNDFKETLVIDTTLLFLMKILDKLLSLKLDNFTELSKSATKVLSLSLAMMIYSYRKELLGSFLQFTGMSEVLFKRQVKIKGKRCLKEKGIQQGFRVILKNLLKTLFL